MKGEAVAWAATLVFSCGARDSGKARSKQTRGPSARLIHSSRPAHNETIDADQAIMYNGSKNAETEREDRGEDRGDMQHSRGEPASPNGNLVQ